jgi:hypothetical protein
VKLRNPIRSRRVVSFHRWLSREARIDRGNDEAAFRRAVLPHVRAEVGSTFFRRLVLPVDEPILVACKFPNAPMSALPESAGEPRVFFAVLSVASGDRREMAKNAKALVHHSRILTRSLRGLPR